LLRAILGVQRLKLEFSGRRHVGHLWTQKADVPSAAKRPNDPSLTPWCQQEKPLHYSEGELGGGKNFLKHGLERKTAVAADADLAIIAN